MAPKERFEPRAPRLPVRLFGYRRQDVEALVAEWRRDDEAEWQAWSEKLRAVNGELERLHERRRLLKLHLAEVERNLEHVRGQLRDSALLVPLLEEGSRVEAERLKAEYENRFTAIRKLTAGVERDIAAAERRLGELVALLERAQLLALEREEQPVETVSEEALQPVAEIVSVLLGSDVSGLATTGTRVAEDLLRFPLAAQAVKVTTRGGAHLGYVQALVLGDVPPRVLGYDVVDQGGGGLGTLAAVDVLVARRGELRVREGARFLSYQELPREDGAPLVVERPRAAELPAEAPAAVQAAEGMSGATAPSGDEEVPLATDPELEEWLSAAVTEERGARSARAAGAEAGAAAPATDHAGDGEEPWQLPGLAAAEDVPAAEGVAALAAQQTQGHEAAVAGADPLGDLPEEFWSERGEASAGAAPPRQDVHPPLGTAGDELAEEAVPEPLGHDGGDGEGSWQLPGLAAAEDVPAAEGVAALAAQQTQGHEAAVAGTDPLGDLPEDFWSERGGPHVGAVSPRQDAPLPGGATRDMPSSQAPPAPSAPPPAGGGLSFGQDVLAFLAGKVVGRDIFDAEGARVATAGEVIDAELLRRVEAAGRLPELIVYMTLPGMP